MKKKYLLAAVLVFSMVFVISCSKPEEVFLKKYFNAVQMQDKDTMAAMAVEPVSFAKPFTFKVKTIGELQEGETEFAEAVKKYQEITKKLEDLKPQVLDTNDELEAAKADLAKVRSFRKKKELKKKVEELQKKKDGLFNQYKELQKEKQAAKEHLDAVVTIIKKSLGERVELENANIKKQFKDVIITVNSASGAKDFKVIFVRYLLDLGNRTQNGRWIIFKFEPLS